MHGGLFDRNEAAQGGGIYADNVQFTIDKDGVQITRNSATLGGGVVVDGGTFTMEDGDITGNTAISGNGTGKGGGLYVNKAQICLMKNAIIRNNTAEYGGGVFMADMGDGKLTMTTNIIKQNSATLGGGGMGLSNTVLELPLVAIVKENDVGQSDNDKKPQNYWLENGAAMNVVSQLDKADRVYVWADIPGDEPLIIATGVKLDRDNFVCNDGTHTASRDIDGNMVLGKKLAVHFAPGEGSGTKADDYAVLGAAYTMPKARQYTPPVGKLLKGWMITGGYKDTKAKAVGVNLVITDEMLVDGDLYLEAVWGDGVDYVDENRTNCIVAGVINLSELNIGNGDIVLNDGWYMADGVTFDQRVYINGEVNLIIDNSFDTTLNKGIQLQVGTTLHIWGQGGWETAEHGKLTVIGGDYHAGIGGSGTTSSGTFVMHSGNVEAIGGSNAAGIGGGRQGKNGSVTIRGGKLKTQGGLGGAGIGGGAGADGGTINLYGGEIEARGGDGAAGIGGGGYMTNDGGDGAKVTIRRAKIHVYGGQDAAAIGGGRGGSGGEVTIFAARDNKLVAVAGVKNASDANSPQAIGRGYKESDADVDGTISMDPRCIVKAGEHVDNVKNYIYDENQSVDPRDAACKFAYVEVGVEGEFSDLFDIIGEYDAKRCAVNIYPFGGSESDTLMSAGFGTEVAVKITPAEYCSVENIEISYMSYGDKIVLEEGEDYDKPEKQDDYTFLHFKMPEGPVTVAVKMHKETRTVTIRINGSGTGKAYANNEIAREVEIGDQVIIVATPENADWFLDVDESLNRPCITYTEKKDDVETDVTKFIEMEGDVKNTRAFTMPAYDVTVHLEFGPGQHFINAEGDLETLEHYNIVSASDQEWTWTERGQGFWYVGKSMTFDRRIAVKKEISLILGDGVELKMNKGIQLDDEQGGKLLIFVTSKGSNSTLTANAQSEEYCAGIGGNRRERGGYVAVYGGKVYAYGGYKAAGIGGGDYKGSKGFYIKDGYVHAEGGKYGAGIGGGEGDYSDAERNGFVDGDFGFKIVGGYVYAKGGDFAAGIGSGQSQNQGRPIIIEGGYVHAEGGHNGAGIGAGEEHSGTSSKRGGGFGTIKIKGGTVKAYGGKNGAGIGGGDNANNENTAGNTARIEITGGNVHAEATGGGAGIGTGEWGYGGAIYITGGNVYAEAKGGGAGIGGGENMWIPFPLPVPLKKSGYVDTIEISNCNIEARSAYGPAIGNGYMATWNDKSAKPATNFSNDMRVRTWVDPEYDFWGDLEKEGYWDNGTDIKKALERRIAIIRACDVHYGRPVSYGNPKEKTHEVTYKCDKCGYTWTKETGHRPQKNGCERLDTWTHKYNYKCVCGKTFDSVYEYDWPATARHSYESETSTKCQKCGANRPIFTITVNYVDQKQIPGMPLTEVYTAAHMSTFDLDQMTAKFPAGYTAAWWIEDMNRGRYMHKMRVLGDSNLRPVVDIVASYDLCGGSVAAGATVKDAQLGIGDIFHTPSENRVRPPREDMVLCGWQIGNDHEHLVRPDDWAKLYEPATVSAIWGYDVTYESDYVDGKGERHATQKVTRVPEGSLLTLPKCTFTAPKDPKLDFAGWKCEGEAELLQPGDAIWVGKPRTIQAIWSAKVSFGPGKNGTGEMQPAFVTPGATYTLPDSGFILSTGSKYGNMPFVGWRINGHKDYAYGTDDYDADILVPGTKITLDNSIHAEAVYAYSLRYEAGGGSGTMPSTIQPLGQTYTLAECAFTPPGDTEFAGWSFLTSTGIEGGMILQPGDQYRMYDSTRYDHVYKAVWMATLHFDANGSAGAMDDVRVRYDADYVLPSCTMLRPEGLSFVGWEVNGAVFQRGDTIHVMDSMTIKPVWDQTYTINFDANGGYGTMRRVTNVYTKDAKYTLPANGFNAPDGANFKGWRILGESEIMQPEAEIDITGSMTLQAVWEVPVVIEAYGETIVETMATRGEPFTMPTYPCPDGRDLTATYEFTEGNWGGMVYKQGDVVTITAPSKLEAAWKALVTFDGNGRRGTMDSVYVEPDSVYEMPDCRFHDSKYDFVGWQVDDEPGYHNRVGDQHITVANNTTLKAMWGWEIAFHPTLSSGYLEPVYVKEGDSCALPENPFTPRANTAFAGWQVGSRTGEVLKPGQTFTPTAYTWLYAAWNVTLTFDANGGSGTLAPVEALSYSEYTLPDNPYTAPGDVAFLGWQVGGDADTIHEAGSTITVVEPVTIRALWSTAITFDPNGGSGTMRRVYVAPGGQGILPECEFVAPEGGRFYGWELDGRVLQPGDSVPGDSTVKACWEKPITVSFEADGGGDFADQIIVVNGKATRPDREPEKNGYKFTNWYLGDAAEPFDFDAAIGEDTTLTARYVEAAMVSFDPGPYGKGSLKSVAVGLNESYTLPGSGGLNCTFGYTDFAGWRVGDSTEVLKTGDTITVTQDVTLTAMWSVRVVFDGTGTDDLEDATVLLGAEFTLPVLPDQPNGKVLQGWKAQTGFVGTPGQTITIKNSYQSSIEPVWGYPVIFDAGEGIGEPLTVYEPGPYMELPECSFKAPGEHWTFTEWLEEGKKYAWGAGSSVAIDAPTTYHAQWGHTHDGEIYQPWIKTDSLPRSGNYYLVNDVDMRGKVWDPRDTKLCLNGKKVSNFAKGDGIIALYDTTVEIFDDGDGTGELGCQTEYNRSRIRIDARTTFILHKGIVSLGLDVDSSANNHKYDGVFRMDGGCLTADGAFVNNGKVTITGGTLLREITGSGQTDTAAKLTFRSGDGIGDLFEMDLNIGQRITVPDNTHNFRPPQNTGRSFVGWRDIDTNTIYMPGEELLIRGSMVLDAIWISAILHFDANGGTGEMADMYVEDQDDFILPESGFTAPETLLFAGWQVDDDAQTVYQSGDTPELMGEHTLKALWKEGMTVRFDSDGGSGEMLDVAVPMNSRYTLPECGFTAPEDHVFEGWLVGETDEKLYQPGEVITIAENLTIYAAWKVTIPTFRTHSLLLNGEIGVNFFMELPEIEGVDYADSYMEFTVESRNGKTTRANFDAEFGDVNGNGYYGFTVNVNSIQMAAPIHAVFHYGGGQTIAQTYSVKDYIVAYEKVKDNYDKRMTALIHALADYGHYAQIMLSDYNNWIIGTDYAEMDVYFTESLDVEGPRSAVSGFAMQSNLGDSEVERFNYSLNLLSQTEMRIMLAFKDGYTGSATYTLDGKTVNSEIHPDGRPMVRIPNIPAQRLDEWHTLTVTTASGTATVSVSPMTYIRWLLNDEHKTYRETGAALYYYNETCEAYRAEQYGEED